MDPIICTIQAFAFNWAPNGWQPCNGQVVPISQNQAVFSLVGTLYGGDGQVTFGLPDLRGRTAISQGQGPGTSLYNIGDRVGSETATLTANNLPPHNHSLNAVTGPAQSNKPLTDSMLAVAGGVDDTSGNNVTVNIYAPAAGTTTLAPQAIGLTGTSMPFSTLSPVLAVNYCICMNGVFPSRP